MLINGISVWLMSILNFPKCLVLLMNLWELMNVLIVRFVITILFYSWTPYGHPLLGLDLFLDEFMDEPFCLTLAMNWTCRSLRFL